MRRRLGSEASSSGQVSFLAGRVEMGKYFSLRSDSDVTAALLLLGGNLHVLLNQYPVHFSVMFESAGEIWQFGLSML